MFIDPQVWKSLLYMLISLGTGIAYFTIVVTMLSTSLGSSVLIIGLPLLLLTLAFVRGMALAEGRLVEALLGTRMPRRPRAEIPGSFFQRLWFWLKDGRTWASLVYLVLMLPLGVVYFIFAVTGIATGLALIAAPFVQLGLPDTTGWSTPSTAWTHFWVHAGVVDAPVHHRRLPGAAGLVPRLPVDRPRARHLRESDVGATGQVVSAAEPRLRL